MSHPHRVVILGSDRLAAKAWREFRVRRGHHVEVVGFVSEATPDELTPDIASRFLGSIAELPRIVVEHDVNDVIVATTVSSNAAIVEHALSTAGALGTRILCLKDICGIHPGSTRDILFELVPAPRLHGLLHAAKRVFNVTVSAASLLLGSFLFVFVAAFGLVLRRPLVYRHETRLGFRRRRFSSWQLCSAPTGPRINLYLQLLPRMWNVLCGDRSLVGPPSVSATEIVQADVTYLAGRFNVRPGMIDTHNIELIPTIPYLLDEPGWSLWTDVKILTRAFRLGSERPGVIETRVGSL